MKRTDWYVTIIQDLIRYAGTYSFCNLIKFYALSPGFSYTVWLRVASTYRSRFLKMLLRRKMIRYGIEIYPETSIGKGLYIGHWGGIVIHPKAKLGINCNLSQGVTIGAVPTGSKAGVPTLGDRVYCGPGAKILGGITIGNDVAIGANAVVVNDVPSGVSVAGVPARVVSDNGSSAYVNNLGCYRVLPPF